jgi:hypothetical protein
MIFKKDKYTYKGEEYTVEGEWLNGVPHGVCITDTEDRRGVYTFTNGKPHGGPIWFEDKGTGERISIEYYDDKNNEEKGV